ncbi:MAG: TorF family putative porin [Moraxellaceae bacterium]|nr:TorF family putative porin [Moraxellaceae bacterium]
MRKTILASLIATTLSAPVLAQESPHSVTGNLAFVNNYFYRGLTQTDDKPALQGGFDYAHTSGFYLGTWATNVSWLDASGKSSLEWDVYGGYKLAVGPVTLDFGALQYFYPGSQVEGATDADTLELYAAATWKWFTAKYSYAVTDLFGVTDSEGSYYPELNFSADVGAGFIAAAHVGRQHIENGTSYNDWKLGVSKEVFSGFTVGAYYVDTDISKPRGLISISKTF